MESGLEVSNMNMGMDCKSTREQWIGNKESTDQIRVESTHMYISVRIILDQREWV